ncbi:MAG: serine protease [Eubacterium sp.]|nr:serine protease [Eubacterium sp.]
MQQNPSDREKQDQKEYPFIKEVIKPPRDRRKTVLRIIQLVIGAAAAGVIAAFVFVKVCPVANRLVGESGQKKGRVSVSADSTEDNSDVKDSSDGERASSATPTATPSPSPTPTPTPEPTEEPEETPEPEEEPEETQDPVAQYRELQKRMNFIAADSEKFLVQVFGIQNELDYFNESYENAQQVTGVLIAEDDTTYYILTENAALEDAEEITVRFSSQAEAGAEKIRSDANTGLAVIRAEKDSVDESTQGSLQIAKLGTSYTLGRGEPVIAVGSPMGYEGMISAGIITSAGSELSLYDTHYHLFTTDIQGSQTGSGVLINLDGRVVGVICQSLGGSSGSIVQALGISEITSLIDTLSNDEPRAFAGIRGETVTGAVHRKTGLPSGLIVLETQTDAPAMLAGLMQLDVITKADDTDIVSAGEFTAFLSECEPGQTVTLTAMRKGVDGYEEMKFEMTLSEI